MTIYKKRYNLDVVRRPLAWVGSALDDLRRFPEAACRVAGHQLDRVQSGLMPDDWKAMTSVGPGVFEIRIRGPVECRVMVVTKLPDAVYVLHAFEKHSQRTRRADLDLARTRVAAVKRMQR